MIHVELDMLQTAGIGALALVVGMVLTRRVAFLQKSCVPSPVSGGLIFSLITLVRLVAIVLDQTQSSKEQHQKSLIMVIETISKQELLVMRIALSP